MGVIQGLEEQKNSPPEIVPAGCFVTGRLLVTSLGGVVPDFVHLAIRSLMDDCWRRIAQRQYSVRHDPRLDQNRVLNGHLVKNLIALTRQPFNHVHIRGMK
jgi:hypothetical protein